VSDDARLVQLCVVRIGGESYALDLKRVEEIVPVPALTPLPKAPSFLEGVVRRRGEVLPVVDARKRLGVTAASVPSLKPSGKPRKTERLVICRIGNRRIGVLVDAVTQVQRVSTAALRPAPMSHRPGTTPHVLGVMGEGDHLTLLLDVKALVTEDELQ
jgi:purine-binding chemotaxis protein CheW